MQNPIDLWTALRYPYVFGNRLRGWLFPALALLLVQIFTVACVKFLPKLVLWQIPRAQLEAVPVTLVDVLQFVVLIFLNVIFCGFLWTMAGMLQDHGKRATLPQWGEHWQPYLFRGIKLFVIVTLWAMLIAFLTHLVTATVGGMPLLALGLLTILYTVTGFFLMVVIIDTSRQYRFTELLMVYRGFACLGAYFVPWLFACVFSVVALALYLLLLQLLGMIFGLVIDSVEVFDTLVLPFALVPMTITIWHILNQPFLPEAEEAETLG